MPLRPSLACLFAASVVAACMTPTSAPPVAQTAAPQYVAATLQPTRGNSAAGTVWFQQEGPMVLVRGRITGLTPNQKHGFHVHEKGDCSSEDAMSAGGHLNPDAKPHGPPAGAHHAGDLPSLKADASGNATVRAQVAGTVLGSGAADLAGKALIVHAAPDDYTTQPTGNSGARIACGLIGATMGRDAAGNPIMIPKDL